MKAKTDSGPTEPDSEMPDYIQNLFQLMALVSEETAVEQFKTDFNRASIRYGDMKKALAEDMVKFIAPIREKAADLYKDKAYLARIIEDGAEQGRASAQETIKLVREAVGLNYV